MEHQERLGNVGTESVPGNQKNHGARNGQIRITKGWKRKSYCQSTSSMVTRGETKT